MRKCSHFSVLFAVVLFGGEVFAKDVMASSTPIPSATDPTGPTTSSKVACDVELQAIRAEFAASRDGLRVSQIEILRDISESQKSQFNLWTTVIGILLAVGGLVIPGIVYLTNIRPVKKAIRDAKEAQDSASVAIAQAKKLEETLEARFLEYTKKRETSEIDTAIELLGSREQPSREYAVNYLTARTYYEHTEPQVAALCAAIEVGSQAMKKKLLPLVVRRDSVAVTRLLSSLLVLPDSHEYMSFVCQHMQQAGGNRILPSVKRWLAAMHGSSTFSDALRVLAASCPGALKEFLNDPSSWDGLSVPEKVWLRGDFVGPADPAIVEMVTGSLLNSEVGGRFICFTKVVDGKIVDCNEDDAEVLHYIQYGQTAMPPVERSVHPRFGEVVESARKSYEVRKAVRKVESSIPSVDA